MKSSLNIKVFVLSLSLLYLLTCTALVPAIPPTTTALPSPVPPTAAPLISQQVTVVAQTLNETNQTPPFTINAQTPQLMGTDDPRVTAFNQQLNDLVKTEVDNWRGSFLENTVMGNGSSLDGTYSLVSQIGDLWSFKFDFRFYSDGAAHPGLYSSTLNYDLGQGRRLALEDLFLPGSNYLEVIANSCIAELSKQPGFDAPFADGAKPTGENYAHWNITAEGLLITFEMYQVLPGASGPQQVLVPYEQLQGIINPQGPLAEVTQ